MTSTNARYHSYVEYRISRWSVYQFMPPGSIDLVFILIIFTEMTFSYKNMVFKKDLKKKKKCVFFSVALTLQNMIYTLLLGDLMGIHV